MFTLFFVCLSSCKGDSRIGIVLLPEVPELQSVVRIMESFQSSRIAQEANAFPTDRLSLFPLTLKDTLLGGSYSLPRDSGRQKAKLSWGQRLADRIFQKIARDRALAWNAGDGAPDSVL